MSFKTALLCSLFVFVPQWYVEASNIRANAHIEPVEEKERRTQWSVQCTKEDVLSTNERLYNEQAVCVHGEQYLYNNHCELHYDANDYYGDCHKELAETSGDDCYLNMQDDGNLVFYDGRKKPVWASDTRGRDAEVYVDTTFNQLLVQVPLHSLGHHRSRALAEVHEEEGEDSYVPVDQGERKERQTEKIDCVDDKLERGTTLERGEYICDDFDDDTASYVGVDSSGCLVSGTVWTGNVRRISSRCSPSAYLQMHSDGNLVLYKNRSGGVLWESDTRGRKSYVAFQSITHTPYIYTPLYSC